MKDEKSELTPETANNSEGSTECGAGCDCGVSGLNTKAKVVICLIVVVVAGLVLLHSLAQKEKDESARGENNFTTSLPLNNIAPPEIPKKNAERKDAEGTEESNLTVAETPLSSPPDAAKTDYSSTDKPAATNSASAENMAKTESGQAKSSLWGNPIESFMSLNKVASNKDAVFVFLPAEDHKKNAEIKKQIEAAATKIQASGNSMSAYEMDMQSPDYKNITARMPAPCVVTMVKGRGMSAVSDAEITEQNLIKALVTASRPSGGCGSGACGSGGCGPSGCQ